MASDVNPVKRCVAKCLHVTGVSRAVAAMSTRGTGGRFIRGINLHQTPAGDAASFERQLRWYQRRFVPVTRDDLAGLVEHGRWPHDKPGLLISFDDGLRSNHDVAAPLLDKYGFIGWFFVPTGLIDCPVAEQLQFATMHDIWGATCEQPGDDGRIAMTWDDLRGLEARGHVIGCHSHTHCRMRPGLTQPILEQEIVQSGRILAERLGRPVETYCWVGGEADSFSADAARAVANAGYRFAFTSSSSPITARTHRLQLDRTNVEARWPIDIVSFQISGIMDLRFAGRRKIVNRLTRVDHEPRH